MSPATRHHILSVLVENKPGVLARVSGLFARRGFNIFSLAVAPTDDPTRSRITIVVDVESAPLEQITKQLDKLINVLQIDELAPIDAVERELMIVTVTVSAESKPELLSLTEEYSGVVLDESGDRITVSLGGTPEALDAFTARMGAAVVGYQRTGRIALPRIV
jgi:acetolactate synthase-1/3 small subunit